MSEMELRDEHRGSAGERKVILEQELATRAHLAEERAKTIQNAGGLLKILRDGSADRTIEVDARRQAHNRIVTLHAALQAMVQRFSPEHGFESVVKQAKAALLGPL